MNTVVTFTVDGTYLVRDDSEPIPAGKTAADISTIVHRHEFGYVCGDCGYAGATSLPDCQHVTAVQESTQLCPECEHVLMPESSKCHNCYPAGD